jgi:hypothetical protein
MEPERYISSMTVMLSLLSNPHTILTVYPTWHILNAYDTIVRVQYLGHPTRGFWPPSSAQSGGRITLICPVTQTRSDWVARWVHPVDPSLKVGFYKYHDLTSYINQETTRIPYQTKDMSNSPTWCPSLDVDIQKFSEMVSGFDIINIIKSTYYSSTWTVSRTPTNRPTLFNSCRQITQP